MSVGSVTNIVININGLPMKYFTPDVLNQPSEKTLRLIKHIAHTYRVVKMANNTAVSYCLN
jgi:hypothetical protein